MKVLADLDFGFAKLQITTEDAGSESSLQDVTVSLVKKEDDDFIQDLVLLRPNPVKQNVQLLVWADEMDESYTDKFDISLYKEAEALEGGCL